MGNGRLSPPVLFYLPDRQIHNSRAGATARHDFSALLFAALIFFPSFVAAEAAEFLGRLNDVGVNDGVRVLHELS